MALPTTQTPGARTKPVIEIASLDDLGTLDIHAEVEHGNQFIRIPMRTLTYFEWQEIGLQVPTPTPPIMGVNKQGSPQYDRNNPDYIATLQRAENERTYRRLARSLKIVVPGETDAEKADALKRTLDTNVTRQLVALLLKFAVEGEARIAARADTFHANGGGDSAHSLEDGADGAPVDSPSAP
jgi:hypothetical protein